MANRLPVGRLLSEGVVVVGSILLAFAIDAWWDGSQERAEEQRIFAALLDEASNNQREFDRMNGYHRRVLDKTFALLDAGAGAPEVDSDSIDHLLIDISSWLLPAYDRSALDATLLGGKMALIRNQDVARSIASWQRDLDAALKMEDDHVLVMREVWTPFLRENASVAQLANAQTDYPGGGERQTRLTPVLFSEDHTELLQLHEFQNLLQEKRWIHEDALLFYGRVGRTLEDLARALREELEG